MLLWAGMVTVGSLLGAVLYAVAAHEPGTPLPWMAVRTRYAIAETTGMLAVVPAACSTRACAPISWRACATGARSPVRR